MPAFEDGNFMFYNSADNTKLVFIDCSLIGTGTVQRYFFPQSGGTLATIDNSNIFTVSQQFSDGLNVVIGGSAYLTIGGYPGLYFYDGTFSQQLNPATLTGNRVVTLPDATTTLAGLSVNSQTFSGAGDVTFGQFIAVNVNQADAISTPFLQFYSVADANTTSFFFDGAFAGNQCVFPAAGGHMLSDIGYADSAFTLKSASAGTGASFRDSTTSTKRLRFPLANASGNNAVAIISTAARTYTMRDYTADAVLVGNTTAAAGTLGRSALTGQTANVGATTLLTSSANSSGLFRVSFYIKTTTAGTPAVATVKFTVAYNDGTAQTADMLLRNDVATPAAPLIGHDLGTLNNASSGDIIVKAAASTAITFTSTGTYTGGAAYSVDARIEALG